MVPPQCYERCQPWTGRAATSGQKAATQLPLRWRKVGQTRRIDAAVRACRPEPSGERLGERVVDAVGYAIKTLMPKHFFKTGADVGSCMLVGQFT